MLDSYGGKAFLAKYFMPTLAEKEKRLFEERFLCYEGQTQMDICKKIKIAQGNLIDYIIWFLKNLKTKILKLLLMLLTMLNSIKQKSKILFQRKLTKLEKEWILLKNMEAL